MHVYGFHKVPLSDISNHDPGWRHTEPIQTKATITKSKQLIANQIPSTKPNQKYFLAAELISDKGHQTKPNQNQGWHYKILSQSDDIWMRPNCNFSGLNCLCVLVTVRYCFYLKQHLIVTLLWHTKGRPPKKRMFTFGHCPNQGGGGPCPKVLALFSPSTNT